MPPGVRCPGSSAEGCEGRRKQAAGRGSGVTLRNQEGALWRTAGRGCPRVTLSSVSSQGHPGPHPHPCRTPTGSVVFAPHTLDWRPESLSLTMLNLLVPALRPARGRDRLDRTALAGGGGASAMGGGARPPEPPTSPRLQVPPLGARPGPCPGPRPLAPRPAPSPPFLGGSAPRRAGALWCNPSSVLKDCSGSRKRAGGGSRRWWGRGGGPGLCLPPHLPLTTQLCPALLKVLS